MTTRALAETTFQSIAPVLRVLGHPDRLRLIERLMRSDLTVGELAEDLSLAPNAVSQHLSIMTAHHIVQRRRNGRYVHYDVVHPAARSLLECMWRNVEQL
jgi:DNA-binding transcriptional ArsR family regulator